MAGALRLWGFSPPRTTLPSSEANERGFWESEPINALNDEFLAELGSTWRGVDALSFDRSPAFQKKAAERAKKVLTQEFDAGVCPLLKDPRLSRLLPLWRPVLAELCSDVIYAIALRSPTAVAESLVRRNDFDPEFSYLLWARYYLDAEFHTRGSRRTIVSYDELVTDWRKALRELPGVGTEATQDSDSEIDAYLSAALRHHLTADEQVFLDLEHVPAVAQTYRALLDWAANGTEPDPDVMDGIRSQIDNVGGMVSRLADNARLDRKRLASARSLIDAERRTPADLAQLKASVEEQSKSQTRLEEQVERLATTLSEAIRERSSLEQLLVTTKAEAVRERSLAEQLLVETKAEAVRERSLAEQLLVETKAEAIRVQSLAEQALAETKAEANAQREAVEHQLEASERDRDALSAELDQARREEEAALAALSAERDEIRTELKDVKKKYRSTQHQLSRDRERLKRTDERLAEEQEALRAIRSSKLWQIKTRLGVVSQRCRSLLKNPFGLGSRKLRADRASRLRASPLFDGDWYLKRYPDVASAGIDPAEHYLENGWKEGRDPSQSFSTASYLKSNPDVARAGLHPLLHFIEFGFVEGRHISDAGSSPAPAIAPPDENFDPAAPCVSYDVAERGTDRWRRAERLKEGAGDLLVRGGAPIGFGPDSSLNREIERGFDLLARLSGHSETSDLEHGQGRSDVAHLADAWFVTNGRLRTRWRSTEPVVVRAYQHLSAEGGVSMVGEGLAVSSLDFVDANLKNQYFPLLFVFSRPNGELRGCAFVGFPTLCRGGLHYPELLALEDERKAVQAETIDIIGTSSALVDRLIALAGENADPLVGALQVDPSGADVTEPVFQAEFQEWLSTVFRIGVTPLAASKTDRRLEYLGSALSAAGTRASGGVLVLPANTVPTISALVAPRAEGSTGDAGELRLLIAGSEPAQPATLLSLPALASSAARASSEFPLAWPVLLNAEGAAPDGDLRATAIRHSCRAGPTDAELLVPVSDTDPSSSELDEKITWLVFPEYWQAETLRQGLQALFEQGTSAHPLIIGGVEQSTMDLAGELFDGRLAAAADVTAALAGIQTPLIGYLGPHVILHDHRTSSILAKLVEDSRVVTASCVIVSADKRGKDWHVSVEDVGMWQTAMPQNVRHEISRLIWRSTYPVLRPPTDLWVAQTSSVNNWLQRASPLRPNEGLQLCTSLVSASYAGSRADAEAPLSPPMADERMTMRAELLFG